MFLVTFAVKSALASNQDQFYVQYLYSDTPKVMAINSWSYIEPITYHQPKGFDTKEEIKAYVLQRIEEEGFDPKIIEKVLNCESGFRKNAIHINANGSKDVGIWQITDLHGLSVADRMDVVKSTDFAIKLLKSKRSYRHWMCYNPT